jgi:hypothetical protein
MKRMIVALILVSALLCGFWLFKSTALAGKMSAPESSAFLLLAGFGIMAGFRRITGFKKGEPVEDELSRSILRRTAALAFYISLYLWLAMAYISGKSALAAEQLIGYGIIGMAVVFVGCWAYFRIRGVKDE